MRLFPLAFGLTYVHVMYNKMRMGKDSYSVMIASDRYVEMYEHTQMSGCVCDGGFNSSQSYARLCVLSWAGIPIRFRDAIMMLMILFMLLLNRRIMIMWRWLEWIVGIRSPIDERFNGLFWIPSGLVCEVIMVYLVCENVNWIQNALNCGLRVGVALSVVIQLFHGLSKLLTSPSSTKRLPAI